MQKMNGVEIEMLGPGCFQKDFTSNSRACSQYVNNFSLVIRLKFGQVRLLFTGDLEKEGERELLARKVNLKADILKIAHHGSRSSSSEAFLDAVHPQVALISAGYRNRFGFPSKEVIQRLHKRGIRIFRTDLDGAIRIRTDGRHFEIRPFQDRKPALSLEGSGTTHMLKASTTRPNSTT